MIKNNSVSTADVLKLFDENVIYIYVEQGKHGKVILVFGLIMRDRAPQSFGVDRGFIKNRKSF